MHASRGTGRHARDHHIDGDSSHEMGVRCSHRHEHHLDTVGAL